MDNRIPFMIYIGETEIKENKIKIKVYKFLLDFYFNFFNLI